jgi:hypothetical protein
MKRLKISFVALAAMLIGICSSAFTAPGSSKLADDWFLYDGSGSVTDINNYNYTGSIASCNSNVRMCAFKGQRQAAPNQHLPTPASLSSASSASSSFTVPVTNLVVFKP